MAEPNPEPQPQQEQQQQPQRERVLQSAAADNLNEQTNTAAAAASSPAVSVETVPMSSTAPSVASAAPATAVHPAHAAAAEQKTTRSPRLSANPHATRHAGKARKVYTDEPSIILPPVEKVKVAMKPAAATNGHAKTAASIQTARSTDTNTPAIAAAAREATPRPAKRKRSPTAGKELSDRRKSKPKERIKQIMVDGHVGYSYTLQNGTVLKANDCIYLICEPPGEPYYLGRIMEFTKLDAESQDIDAVRVNWFYRPRDVQRQSVDSRLVYATMHSDISPLASIRGKCRVEHRSQIPDADAFRKQPDCFYYDKLFDKFIHRYYEVIPVEQVLNVPDNVKRVLLERWRYVVVEMNRGKELAMEHRACKRCSDWCSSKDSVRCVLCKADYHMQCVQPPMPRKPSRGFAWTCTPCSRAEMKRMEEARVLDVELLHKAGGKERLALEQKERQELWSAAELDKEDEQAIARQADAPSVSLPTSRDGKAKPEQWPYRYMGIHCNLADVLDADDRIYPRAASRIGTRHQCTVQDWHGHPVEYFERVKRAIKRTPKAMKGKRSDERAAVANATGDVTMEEDVEEVDVSETPDPASLPANERLPWMQEKPSGYLARGEGKTAETIWLPETVDEAALDAFMVDLQPIADKLKVAKNTPNLMDAALKALLTHKDPQAAHEALRKVTRHKLGEPSLTADEKQRFNQAVHKFGSELHQVAQEVGTKSVAECVRFYYNWKKSPAGQEFWGGSEARRPKTDKIPTVKTRAVPVTELETIADSSDDSAYDSHKAAKVKKTFSCKYCKTNTSSRWRRAPGMTGGHGAVTALCNRCGELWRRYAVQWEAPEEVYRKVHELGAKSKKRKFEEELLKELPPNGEKPEKPAPPEPEAKVVKKIKIKEPVRKERPPTPVLPDPCEVCLLRDEAALVVCSKCSLRVHASCYGVQETQPSALPEKPWTCDVCINESTPTVSTAYTCVLCPITSPRGPLKRTAGNNWAHIACATWQPELRFGDVNVLQPIEGIGALPLPTWQALCTLCHTQNGACVLCTTCAKPVHVTCAQRADYKLGFALQPVKSSQSRRDQLSLVRIGNASGLLSPVVHCPDHDLRRAGTLYGMQEPTGPEGSGGEAVSRAFIRTYKSSEMPLARQPRGGGSVRRFAGTSAALVLATKTAELRGQAGSTASADAEQEVAYSCGRCAVTVSPLWHADGTLCHLCHWKETRPGEAYDREVPALPSLEMEMEAAPLVDAAEGVVMQAVPQTRAPERQVSVEAPAEAAAVSETVVSPPALDGNIDPALQ